MSLLGITMFYFRIPFFGLVVLSPDLAPLVTVLWVAGMANAVNFIDGLDGLAAGTVAIAAGAFFLYAQRLNDAGLLAEGSISPMVSVIVLGMCVGFLPHNFHPAHIFMGDCGALLLGLLMAASTIVVGGRASEPFSGQTYFFFAPLFIPLFILGVPILDTAFAIVRRATRAPGSRPWTKITCTTGCCASGTATAAASSSSGPGRRSCRDSSCIRRSLARVTRSCRSVSRRSDSLCTCCFIRASAELASTTPDSLGAAPGLRPGITKKSGAPLACAAGPEAWGLRACPASD